MPFFVFAIHQDETRNRLYHEVPFQKREAAEELCSEMTSGRAPGDNYVVRLIEADTLKDAEIAADKLRHFPRFTK